VLERIERKPKGEKQTLSAAAKRKKTGGTDPSKKGHAGGEI